MLRRKAASGRQLVQIHEYLWLKPAFPTKAQATAVHVMPLFQHQKRTFTKQFQRDARPLFVHVPVAQHVRSSKCAGSFATIDRVICRNRKQDIFLKQWINLKKLLIKIMAFDQIRDARK